MKPYAGVLDWMTSESLSHVNSLLRNRFRGFMELENMAVLASSPNLKAR
ncbi:DUF1796 family putative cysteine peptidase [Paenibacillus sp. MBLB4367]